MMTISGNSNITKLRFSVFIVQILINYNNNKKQMA